MRHAYQVIVIGCGGIGSAAAYWPARRIGGGVLAIEQFPLGHDRGSSQDHSRIIRRSYHDPSYTALAGPAYDVWSDVEAESGVQLVFKTGGLDLELLGTKGPKDLCHCETYIPGFLGPELYTKTCLYTMPPDRHFVIDALPCHPRITVAVDAGHAFKFATLIGRILSELALDGRTDYSIATFRADRPALTDPTFEPAFRNEAVLNRT